MRDMKRLWHKVDEKTAITYVGSQDALCGCVVVVDNLFALEINVIRLSRRIVLVVNLILEHIHPRNVYSQTRHIVRWRTIPRFVQAGGAMI